MVPQQHKGQQKKVEVKASSVGLELEAHPRETPNFPAFFEYTNYRKRQKSDENYAQITNPAPSWRAFSHAHTMTGPLYSRVTCRPI
jgi:hypothetical protein